MSLGWWRTDVVVTVLAICVVAGVGGALTAIGPWYLALKQPPWKPPDWAFGPAWTVIYASTGWAIVLAWRDTSNRRTRDAIVLVSSASGILNALWSFLFFSMRRPDWALIQVVSLLASIIAMMWVFRHVSLRAALLLLPYLLWVCFASALNCAVVRLNQPFST